MNDRWCLDSCIGLCPTVWNHYYFLWSSCLDVLWCQLVTWQHTVSGWYLNRWQKGKPLDWAPNYQEISGKFSVSSIPIIFQWTFFTRDSQSQLLDTLKKQQRTSRLISKVSHFFAPLFVRSYVFPLVFEGVYCHTSLSFLKWSRL